MVGLDHQRPVGQVATDLHALPLGAGMNQFQGLLNGPAHPPSRFSNVGGRAKSRNV